MKTLLKSLIVWLMLLAIPFQGFASATMLICAPIESAPQLAAMAPAAVAHHHADTAMGAQHHHHADDATAADHATVADHADHATAAHDHVAHVTGDDDAAAHHHAGGKCNSCATCCFGAIMAPSSASRVPAEVQNFAFFSLEVERIANVDLAHPERPPQASLT